MVIRQNKVSASDTDIKDDTKGDTKDDTKGDIKGDIKDVPKKNQLDSEDIKFDSNGSNIILVDCSRADIRPDTDGVDDAADSKSESSGSGLVLLDSEGGSGVPGMVARVTACAAAGIWFGWMLEKSRVFEPSTIRRQMVFQQWIMLKMFLGAIGIGQITLSVISLIPHTRPTYRRAVASFAPSFSDKGLLTSILGPFILGSGMTVCGACPGMVLAQVGAWAKNSIFTLIGVLLGALVYGLLAKYIVKITRPKTCAKKQTVHEYFGIPYAAVSIVCGALFLLTVVLLEVWVPWKEDLDPSNYNSNSTSNIMQLRSWPPSLSGALIGVLQLVIVLAFGDTLGGSSSYMTIVSQWVFTDKLKQTFPYMAKFRCGLGNWWQVVYVSCAMLGATFSSLASDSFAAAKGVSIPCALGGGVMLLFGARLGAGCTSGHGLSGTGLLFWYSIIALPAMFAGGVATGFLMMAAGALDEYRCHGNNQQCQ